MNRTRWLDKDNLEVTEPDGTVEVWRHNDDGLRRISRKEP